jgi:hypothetical protein
MSWMYRFAARIAVAVVLCGATATARASCPVALDGDAAVVEQVRAELVAFSDDGTPCVALSARCWRSGDQLAVHVSDALGRTAERTVASPGGAAAFIVSWSLRPTDAPGVRPAVVASRPALDPTSDGLRDRTWHPEVALGYLASSGPDRSWGTISASVIRRMHHLRFGGGLHALAGNRTNTADIDVEIAFGAVWDLAAQWSIRAELSGTRTLLTLSQRSPILDGYGAVGMRGGGRAVLGWQIDGPLGIEIGLGYDAVRAIGPSDTGFGPGPWIGYSRLDLGIRWVP